jgi:GTP-binding protein
MFTDEVVIKVKSGRGGDGMMHFHRAKYVPKGGPDGGDGGDGGSIWIETAHNLHTLSAYRAAKNFLAEDGKKGGPDLKHGRNGEKLVLRVPVGTCIKNKITGEILADMTRDGQSLLICKGGIGGKGNAGFVNSVRQAPKFAELGDSGEEVELHLELKLVADVALVGYPSVGKSTLISVLSAAKPKIAEYHFTTLVPNLGVMNYFEHSLVLIDVPGLIEGASDGKGLGLQFLRHIERAKLALLLIEGDSNTPLKDIAIIRQEMEKFSQNLSQKQWVIGISKTDLIDEEMLEFIKNEITKEFPDQKIITFSAQTHNGLDDLKRELIDFFPGKLDKNEADEVVEKIEVNEEGLKEFNLGREGNERDTSIVLEKTIQDDEDWGEVQCWRLNNKRLERMSRQTEITSMEATERVYDVLRKWNITRKLESRGAVPGDRILIENHEWIFRG